MRNSVDDRIGPSTSAADQETFDEIVPVANPFLEIEIFATSRAADDLEEFVAQKEIPCSGGFREAERESASWVMKPRTRFGNQTRA